MPKSALTRALARWDFSIGPDCKLTADHLQWIVMRRVTPRPGATRKVSRPPYEAVGYVCSNTDIVARVAREHGCTVNYDWLARLPYKFEDWLAQFEAEVKGAA